MNSVKTWTDGIFSGTVFKVLYLILAFASFNSYIFHQPFMIYFIWLVTIFGAFNCVYRLIHFKRYIRTPYLFLGGLFILSYVITTVLNLKYGFLESVQGLVWIVFQLAMLYACDAGKTHEELKAEFKLIGVVFVSYNTVACIISIAMVVLNYGNLYMPEPLTVIPQGFVWGRLWGVFSDPNYASASVCISSVLCLYLYTQAKKGFLKILAIVSLIASFLYIVFSDSRTGYVTLICVLLLWFYVSFHQSQKLFDKKDTSITKRRIMAAVLSLAVAAGTFGAMYGTKLGYNSAIMFISNHSTNSENKPNNEEIPSDKTKPQIERDYEQEVDISNRRIDLWKSGIELFRTSPIAGVGFRNIQAAARDRIPNTYLLNNSAGEFDAYHNMWVDILVSQGIIGFLLFLAMAICCFISAVKILRDSIKTKSEGGLWFTAIFAASLASVVSSLFLSDTIYVNTPNAVMFWILLGYMMRFVYDKKLIKMQ